MSEIDGWVARFEARPQAAAHLNERWGGSGVAWHLNERWGGS